MEFNVQFTLDRDKDTVGVLTASSNSYADYGASWNFSKRVDMNDTSAKDVAKELKDSFADWVSRRKIEFKFEDKIRETLEHESERRLADLAQISRKKAEEELPEEAV